MKKTISSPLLSAFVFPGAGQLKNHQYVKGLIFVLITIVLLSLIVYKAYAIILSSVTDPSQINLSEDFVSKIEAKVYAENNTLVLFLIIVWLGGVIDAYLGARKG